MNREQRDRARDAAMWMFAGAAALLAILGGLNVWLGVTGAGLTLYAAGRVRRTR